MVREEGIELTLSELNRLTGISDATISRLRGEKEPIKKFNINLLKRRVNYKGVKVVNDEDLKLLIIYKIYASIPGENGKPKKMKNVIEELNDVFSRYEYNDVIDQIKRIFEERIDCLNKLKKAEDLNLLEIINCIKIGTICK